MKRSSIRFLVFVFAASILLTGVAQAQYAGGLTLSTTTPSPGSEVRVSGSGFAAGATVNLTFESTPSHLGTVTADPTGSFSTTVRIPSDASPGVHTIRASGEGAGGGTHVQATSITIPGRTTKAGSSTPWILLGILGLSVVGLAVLAALGRARRHGFE